MIKRAALLVALVVFASLLVAGCTSPANTQATSPTATTNAAIKTKTATATEKNATAQASPAATVTISPTAMPTPTPSATPTPTPSARPIPTKLSFVVGHGPPMVVQGGTKIGGVHILANNNPIPTNGLVVDIFVDGTYVGQAATPQYTPLDGYYLSYSFSVAGLSVGSHSENFVFPGNAQYAPSSVQGTFAIVALPSPSPTQHLK